tara:strand:+ start:134 stop:607 length:474 start_codon:yes stop_codon:yes gene_type:complete
MFCNISCFVAILFLIANVYVMLTIDCENTKNRFYRILNNSQQQKYEKIVKERKNIYFTGYIIGIILSILVILINKYIFNKRMNNGMMVCCVGAISFTTNYLYYILIPKSTYMIKHLNNQQQIEEWLKINRSMQVKYHIGLLLGIVAIMVFAFANRCK